MEIEELLTIKRRDILDIASHYGAYNVRVFGSVARGDARNASDIDFLVDLQQGRSLFDLGGLLMDLQALLHRKVDVITPAGLRPRIRSRVIKEAIPL